MERLTQRVGNEIYVECGDKVDITEKGIIDLLKTKLAAYEDAEEQGRLVVLPCKVGERVFHFYQGYIDMVTVQRIRPYIMTEMLSFWPEDFGKTVFLTREEAEKALEGMK